MNALFLDPQRRLRNGWWLLAFLALFIGSRQIYTPTVRLLKEAGVAEAWLEPMPFLFVLMVTAICTTLRAESLASVGFRLDRRWFVQFAAGSVAGAASIALIAVIVATTGALSLTLDPARSFAALAHGAWVFLCVALFEEALFRGFAFQRVVAGAGIGVAQVVFALLFALAHWDNPGMDGLGRTVASVDIALGALLYGLAWWRTGSLALPIGLHFGWNLMQGPVLGFPVSGVEPAGWWQPLIGPMPSWISGGAVGLEGSVVAVVVDVVALAVLWWWPWRKAQASAPPQLEPCPAVQP